MKAIKLFLLAGVTLLALSSCQKVEKLGGQAIRFSASSVGTKTAYDETAPGQINWVNEELVRVWSDKATLRYDASVKYYDYVIADASGNEATLSNQEGSNGLVYVDGVDEYQFWAVSPASAVAKPTDGVANYTIKANQAGESIDEDGVIPADMDQAVLLASATGPWMEYGNTTKTYQLMFQPAFTAFEITLKGASAMAEGEVIELTKVELVSGDGLAGDVTATFGTDGLNFAAEVTPLTFTFPEGTTLTQGTTVKFTVFAVPLDGEGLKLKFTLGDGQVRTATLFKGSGDAATDFPIVACQKHLLYGLAMPNDFKMFASEEELKVADTTPVDSNLNL